MKTTEEIVRSICGRCCLSYDGVGKEIEVILDDHSKLSPFEKAETIRELKLMRSEIAEARRLIDAACGIMTADQVGQWSGVRTWLEMTTSDLCPCCAGEGCWNCVPDSKKDMPA